MWHLDGNDKLKPYGFCIHGCIDGFSRKLIWLEVSSNNKHPSVVLNYYLKAVEKLGMVPLILRMDRGTENFTTGDVQMLLRSCHEDDLIKTATMYGSSPHNQRIERFWGYLKLTVLQPYMDVFKDLEMAGLLDRTNKYHMDCLYFCFIDLLKTDLEIIMETWNAHRVRKTKESEIPAGIPNFLFDTPTYYGYNNVGKMTNQDTVSICKELYPTLYNTEYMQYEEWALNLMLCNHWVIPKTIDESLTLYGKLLCLQH